MSDPTPSSKSGPYLFRVPENVAASLRRYTVNRMILIPGASLAWTVVGIPVFVMDVFDLNLNTFFCVALLLVPLLLVHLGASAVLLNKPTRALAEVIRGASGKRVIGQDVVQALKKAPWGATGKGVASSTKPTMKDGMRFSSKGNDWLIRFSPDLSTGTLLKLVSGTTSSDSKENDDAPPNEHIIVLPKPIAARRTAAAMKSFVLFSIIFVSGFIFSLNQHYVSPNLLILAIGFIAIGLTRLIKKFFMASSNREVAEFITASLDQSPAFREALFWTLTNGTFRRIRQTAFSQSIEILEVVIRPVGEPSWFISELSDGKGHRLWSH